MRRSRTAPAPCKAGDWTPPLGMSGHELRVWRRLAAAADYQGVPVCKGDEPAFALVVEAVAAAERALLDGDPDVRGHVEVAREMASRFFLTVLTEPTPAVA